MYTNVFEKTKFSTLAREQLSLLPYAVVLGTCRTRYLLIDDTRSDEWYHTSRESVSMIRQNVCCLIYNKCCLFLTLSQSPLPVTTSWESFTPYRKNQKEIKFIVYIGQNPKAEYVFLYCVFCYNLLTRFTQGELTNWQHHCPCYLGKKHTS